MTQFLKNLLRGGLILSIASFLYVLADMRAPHAAIDLTLPSVVYVYRSTPCPKSVGHFQHLEFHHLLDGCQLLIIDAATLEKLFGITCNRFPSVLFIKDGAVYDRIEGATTVDTIQTRAQILMADA